MRIENVLSATVNPQLQPTVFDSIKFIDKLPVAVITDINKEIVEYRGSNIILQLV